MADAIKQLTLKTKKSVRKANANENQKYKSSTSSRPATKLHIIKQMTQPPMLLAISFKAKAKEADSFLADH